MPSLNELKDALVAVIVASTNDIGKTPSAQNSTTQVLEQQVEDLPKNTRLYTLLRQVLDNVSLLDSYLNSAGVEPAAQIPTSSDELITCLTDLLEALQIVREGPEADFLMVELKTLDGLEQPVESNQIDGRSVNTLFSLLNLTSPYTSTQIRDSLCLIVLEHNTRMLLLYQSRKNEELRDEVEFLKEGIRLLKEELRLREALRPGYDQLAEEICTLKTQLADLQIENRALNEKVYLLEAITGNDPRPQATTSSKEAQGAYQQTQPRATETGLPPNVFTQPTSTQPPRSFVESLQHTYFAQGGARGILQTIADKLEITTLENS